MSVETLKSNTEDKILNTRRLQIHELNMFMLNEHSALFDGVCFTSVGFSQSFSFEHAMKLFNSKGAESSMLIQQVNLRLEKSNKKIVCTKHLVKFTQEVKDYCEDMNIKCEQLLKSFIDSNRF